MEYSNLNIESGDGVAVLEVNRPQVLNALNQETMEELESALDQLGRDPSISSVILTGSGEKAFIAGADIQELAKLDPLAAKSASRRGHRLANRIEKSPKPIIAAINGFCLGGGCELALASHLRVAASTARIGLPEVKLGLIPGYGGTQRLARLVGKGAAFELILTGEMIDASRALDIGLVNRVVASEELMDTCRNLAEQIRGVGPLSVRYCLEAVNTGLDMPLEEALSLEASLFGLSFATQDMKEGTTAFLEKRSAEFKGR